MRWKLRSRGPVMLAAALLLLFPGSRALWAQATGTVSGTVRSASTQEPVAGAAVEVVGASLVGLTDAEGRYTIESVPAGEYTLRVNMLGFSRDESAITVVSGEAATADFELQTSAITLDELVVTGTAGAQSKRELGNSVGKINVAEELETAPINNATELLTARTPGLTLMSNSGQAGASSNIRIRGAGSLSGGYEPVFYVDGIRVQGGGVEGDDFMQGGSALDFLNPDDIESIEVIKGPAAATLYGAEAANGVIQIITKKGSRAAQGPQWTVSMDYGENEWLESTSDGNYMTYRRCTEAMQTDDAFPGCQIAAGNLSPDSIEWWGRDEDGDAQLFNGIPEEDIISIPGTNQFVLRDNPLFRHPSTLRTGTMSTINASVRGGTSAMGYFLSFNKSDEEGVYFNNFSDRIGGRANFDYEVRSNLNLSTQVSYTRTHLQQPLGSNASNGLVRNAMRGRARAEAAPWEAGFLGFSPGVTNEFDWQNRIERTTIGLTANWAPFDWFRHRLTLGLDKQDFVETEFTRQDTTGQAPWGAIEATGEINHQIRGAHRWTVDYVGTVERQLSDVLNGGFSTGVQLNASKRRDFFADGEGLVANNLNSVGSAATRDADEEFEEQTSLGLFFEGRLGWRDRLYATGAVRVDDNSAFGSDFNLVVYPKASLSWVVSEEDFFNLAFADEVKLRFAWGRAGNAPEPFTADRTFTSAQGVAADALVNALTISAYGNPNLKAETGQEWEAGFDASLLNGRAGLEFTYYNQKTVDALVEVPDPGSTGFTEEHLVNIGEISNQGIELLLTGTPVAHQNFVWDASLSLSTNSNKLESFNGARQDIIFGAFADVQRHREGYPLGGFWASDVERDANGEPIVRDDEGNIIEDPLLDADGQNVTVLNSCRWAPNDPDWDQATECEDIFMGPSRPTREAAFTSTFTLFNDFRIYTQFDYRGGHYQWCAACSLGTRIDLNTWDVNTGGTQLNPDVSVADVLAMQSLQTKSHISKADFIKLRELSLTYAIPERLTQALRSRWSVTLSGRNLAIWTKYKGKGDPEVQFDPTDPFTILDYASTPQTRRLSASVQVTF